MKKYYILLSILILVLLFNLGCLCKKYKLKGHEAAEDVWTKLPASLWSDLLPDAKTDAAIPIPKEDLALENIGIRTRVEDLFDKWTLKEDKRDRLFMNWADVTTECKGLIETEYLLDAEQWAKTENQIKYYESVEKLIEQIADRMIKDMGGILQGEEKDLFVRALQAVIWNESLWEHYFRYKNWFFVLLSDQSFNKLSGWGISQISRSDYIDERPLSQNFFDSKAYCKMSSSIYYGMLIYYYYYLDARQKTCNGTSTMNRIIGAYNSYSSGYSACFYDISDTDPEFAQYQAGAIGGFLSSFVNERWKQKIDTLKETLER